MKLLAIHADFIEFQAKKKAFKAAEVGVTKDSHKIKECLVIFTAVEKRDEGNIAQMQARYQEEVTKIAAQVNAENIVLYPYAHLSSDLAAPNIAEEFLKTAQKDLSKDYQVSRAPFGWYKSFNIACKGHPLSELSREFGPEAASNLKRVAKDEAFTLDSSKLEKEQKVALSCAYLVGTAIKNLFPKAELGSAGFYHDQAYIDIANVSIKQDLFKKIKKEVNKLRGSDLSFTKSKEKLQSLQVDIASDLKKAQVYKIGDQAVVPLFNNPFINSSKEIGAFKLLNIASAYWKNNENNQQLTRVYCVAFSKEAELKEWEQKQEEAENRSHLKIGKEQGLFLVSKLVGSGLPLLAPNGMIIREEIVKFLWELHKDKGYQRVWTPHIAKSELYKTSGHWDKFGDELFKVQGKEEQFVMKPMNCPHHMQIFDNFSYSYRDLPVRFFEPATVYRDEKSGQLLGLSRVRAITQDDGHLFCRISQIEEEVATVVSIVNEFFGALGMNKEYWVSLSVRGDDKSKYLGEDKVWNIAEKALESAAKKCKLPYKRIEGEAAFYGPKLDFTFKDAMGREWQLATIQCDFNLPQRFKLHYMNEKSQKEQPVVIHRAISGSLERFMSLLIEHFAGKFPTWLSPVQVKIVTLNDSHKNYAHDVAKQLKQHDVRVEVDDRVESIGKKVRDAQLQQVNYILTVGDKEVAGNTVAIRTRAGKQEFDVPVDTFVKKIIKEIAERKL